MAELAPLGIPLIVNDRPAVAQAIGADGVHIGQDDGDPRGGARLARAGRDPRPVGDAGRRGRRRSTPAVVDYVGLGPVFATATKADAAPPLGLDGFARGRARLPVPFVAIGGIERGNAAAIIAAGAAGIAVVSAICAAPDPRAAAAALRGRDGRRAA